jgi:hypothetical protein
MGKEAGLLVDVQRATYMPPIDGIPEVR